MPNKLVTITLAVGATLGMTALSLAQTGSGGTSGSAPQAGSHSGDQTKAQGKGQGKGGTIGQGASQYAPGHNPKQATPGQGGTPPGQKMNEQKDKQNNAR